MQRSRSPQPSMSRETKVRRQHAVTHPRPGAKLWQGYLCVPLLGHLLWCCILGPWYPYHTPFIIFRDWIVIVGCNAQFTDHWMAVCVTKVYIPDHLQLFYWMWMKPRNEAEEAVVGGLLTLTSTGRDFCRCQANDFQTRSHLHIVVQTMYGVTWLSHVSHMMITSLLSQMLLYPLTAMPRLSHWSFLRSFRRVQGRWFWPSSTRGSSTTRCEDSIAQSTPTLTTQGKRDMQLSLSLR